MTVEPRKAENGTKLVGKGPFGVFGPENRISRPAGAIQTGFGGQNWPKPLRNQPKPAKKRKNT